MSKSLKKIVEESREKNLPEVDMCDRGISNLLDIPGLCESAVFSQDSFFTSLKFYIVLMLINLILMLIDFVYSVNMWLS